MNKTLLALACLALAALPVAVQAAAPKSEAHPVHHAASVPAPAASAVDGRVAVRTAQQRGTGMAACRKQVGDQGLSGQAYKDALVACMKQGH